MQSDETKGKFWCSLCFLFVLNFAYMILFFRIKKAGQIERWNRHGYVEQTTNIILRDWHTWFVSSSAVYWSPHVRACDYRKLSLISFQKQILLICDRKKWNKEEGGWHTCRLEEGWHESIKLVFFQLFIKKYNENLGMFEEGWDQFIKLVFFQLFIQ